MNLNVTVCELSADMDTLESSWNELVKHVREHESDLLVLPEMPFYRWLCQTDEPNNEEWNVAVQTHLEWIGRFNELGHMTIVGSRPDLKHNKRVNSGFLWNPEKGLNDLHYKYYLPDEPGFWEATWYERGGGTFRPADTEVGKIGFLVCTELWFNKHARQYGKDGVQLLICPRVTPAGSAHKWVAGGQTAAVVSGAYCLSSNLSGTTPEGGDYAGLGWIIEPEEGEVLGLTDKENPFLTRQIDLSHADRAKTTYPRYVKD